MFTFKYFHIPKLLSREYCTRALQALEKIIQIPQQGVIHLIAIPAADMALLNEQYRGKEGATDILTFSYLDKKQKAQSKKHKEGSVSVILGQEGYLNGITSRLQYKVSPLRSRDERDPGIQANNLRVANHIYITKDSYFHLDSGSNISPLTRGKYPSGMTDNEIHEDDELTVVGEIYLCLEKIQFYAKDASKTYKDQLEHTIIHGLVHLMGYDHESEEEAEVMEGIEGEIHASISSSQLIASS